MSKFNPNAAVWKPPTGGAGGDFSAAPAAGSGSSAPSATAPAFFPSANAPAFQPGGSPPSAYAQPDMNSSKKSILRKAAPQQPLQSQGPEPSVRRGGTSPPVAPSDAPPRGQTVYSSRRDAKTELPVTHAKLLSLEDELKEKFHLTTAGFDDQMLKLFCILHQENLLCLSSFQLFERESSAADEGTGGASEIPRLILAPFWDDFNVADFHGIQETILAAEECRMELEDRGEAIPSPADLKALLAQLEPSIPPHFVTAYIENLLPSLLGSEAEKVALSLIVEEMYIHRHTKMKSALLRQQVDKQAAATSGAAGSSANALMYVNEASRMELSEAIGYALVLVYTVVRITNLSFKEDAARMDSLRQKLYSYPGSRSFVRWCLPVLVAAEIHSTNLANLKKSYPPDSVHGKACTTKSAFGKLLQKISIGFLALPPNCPVKMFYEALAPVVDKSKSLAYSIFGELYHAYPRFEEQLMTESSFNVIHLMKGSGARLPVVPPPKVLNAMQLSQEVAALSEEEEAEERAILDALRSTTTTTTTTKIVSSKATTPSSEKKKSSPKITPADDASPASSSAPAPPAAAVVSSVGFGKPPPSSSSGANKLDSLPVPEEAEPMASATPTAPGERSLALPTSSTMVQNAMKSMKEGTMTSLSTITLALQSLHDCCALLTVDLQHILSSLKKSQQEEDWKYFEEVYKTRVSTAYAPFLDLLYTFFERKSNSHRRLLSKYVFMAKKRRNIYKKPGPAESSSATTSLGFGGGALLNFNGSSSSTTTTAGGGGTDLSSLTALAAAFSPAAGSGGGVWGAGANSGW